MQSILLGSVLLAPTHSSRDMTKPTLLYRYRVTFHLESQIGGNVRQP